MTMIMNVLLIFICLLCRINSIISDVQVSRANEKNKTNSDYLEDSNFFLDYIFKKYGTKDRRMSYEGFEHLLHNLGLGRLKFDKDHTLDQHKNEDGNFLDIHDILELHKHNHTDRIRAVRIPGDDGYRDLMYNENQLKLKHYFPKRCFTPEEIFKINNLEPNHKVKITPEIFLNLCTVIVYELDQKSCSDISVENVIIKANNTYFMWLSAFISVLVISLVGLLGVGLVPLLQKTFFEELINFLVALAVGTLCGDSFLHLLPHALEVQENEHPRMAIFRAGTIFLSVLFFFTLENLFRKNKIEEETKEEEYPEQAVEHKIDIQLQEKSMLHSHSHNTNFKVNSVTSVAFMVIMGDGLHNLTDGLAIGASFSGNIISGFSTAVAVLTHELPHELGDFAVLLQTGMTVSQALFYNILSSVLSFIGMTIGIILGNFSSASQWIYAITAGAFLYIGLVNLIPEIKKPTKRGNKQTVIQFIGFLSGGLIMLFIALFEHDIENIFIE